MNLELQLRRIYDIAKFKPCFSKNPVFLIALFRFPLCSEGVIGIGYIDETLVCLAELFKFVFILRLATAHFRLLTDDLTDSAPSDGIKATKHVQRVLPMKVNEKFRFTYFEFVRPKLEAKNISCDDWV